MWNTCRHAHICAFVSLSLSLSRAFSKRRAREASSPSRIAHYFLSRSTHNTTPISSRFFLFSLPSFLERTESYNRTEKRCSTIFITTVPQRLHTIASYIYLHCKCPTLLMSRVIIVDDDDDDRPTRYSFLRRVARASRCFVSVASCSFESSHQFSSSESSESSSKKRRRRRDVLSNTKNLPDVSPAVAKRALAELSRRQQILDYEPSAEEKRTVNEFVNASIARVIVACGLTGAFGYFSSMSNSSDGTNMMGGGFKNKTNAFRARVVVGVATGIVGGLFEYRSVNFYRNLLVKVLDAQEDGSKMSGELAQILRETDPLGALVRDQDGKKNRERLSGFRVGRERMTASPAAVFAEHRETRREGEEKEDAPHSNTTTTAARDERHRRERRRPSGLGAPSPFVFADVFETSSWSDDDDVNDENTTERHKRRQKAAFRTKELERRKRIKEIGVERRRQNGVAFDDA